MRKLREEYGMVNLLNWLFQCEKYEKKAMKYGVWDMNGLKKIEKLKLLIKDKKLISESDLAKIKED